MIDNQSMMLDVSELLYHIHPMEIMKKLNNVKEDFDERGNKNYYAWIRNLRVKLTPFHLIISGSFNKFYFGDNLNELVFCFMKKLISELNAYFPIDIREAKITRIEIGCNINTDLNPMAYLLSMTSYKKAERKMRISTLYFDQSNRKMRAYDKIKHIRKENKRKILNLRHVLRLEFLFKKNLRTYLNVDHFNLEDILNPKYWALLQEKFIKEFKHIKFKRLKKENIMVDTLTDLKNATIVILWSATELSRNDFINLYLDKFEVPKSKRKSYHSQLMALLSSQKFTELNPLKKELSEKFCEQFGIALN